SQSPGLYGEGFVVRLNPDGSQDETFDIGVHPDGFVSDLLLLPSGDLLAAGSFSIFDDVPRQVVVRLKGGSAIYSKLALAPASTSIVEGEEARFTISRTGVTNVQLTVQVDTMPGTANAGSDFI